MGRKIVFASGKGGVGKSTVSANLAVAAMRLGEEVVLLDADMPMADLALSFGLDIDGPTAHEVLSGEAEVSEAIYSGPEGLSIIPGGISLDGVRKAKLQKLEELLDQLSERFKTILVDSPSGLGQGALMALRTSDELVLVTDPVVTSLSDALRTKRVSERFGTGTLGVVISRTSDVELDVPRKEIESMLDIPILGVIPEDPEVLKSMMVGEPVIARSPSSRSSLAFQRLAWEIFVKRGPIDYQELSEKSISEIKKIARKKNVNYRALLKFEKSNKNRKTLKRWLMSNIGKSQ